jgi:WD40 repeat protein
VWDIRNVEELYCFNACPETEKTYSANSCCFDKSAKIIAVACEDHVIRIFNENEGNESQPENEMSSEHKDIVHDIKFDFNSKMLVSCGADNTVRVF